MKATGIVRRIDDLGRVVNQGVSAPIRTPEVESAPRFRVRVAGILRHQRFQDFHDLLIFDICGIGKLLAVFIPYGAKFKAFLDVVQDSGDICDLLCCAAMLGRCTQSFSKHGFI